MEYGLSCYDATGAKTFEVSDRLPRALGIVNVTGTDGSLTDSNMTFGSGAGYAIFSSTDGKFFQPVVSVVGGTISWTYGGGDATTRSSGFITYGVY